MEIKVCADCGAEVFEYADFCQDCESQCFEWINEIELIEDKFN